MNQPYAPHDLPLTALRASPERQIALKEVALDLPSIDLDWQQTGALEMLQNGAYSPLCGYMGRADYESVLENLNLADGTPWPLPLTLKLNEKQAANLQPGSRVALRDSEGFLLALLTISEKWLADVVRDQELLNKSPVKHGIALESDIWHVGGSLEGISLTVHHDFLNLRVTPRQLRTQFAERGWQQVIGWLAHQPMTRAQFDFCQNRLQTESAKLLLLPFGGGDLAERADYFALMRTYQKILPRFSVANTQLAMLPIQSHSRGLRDALLRVILAHNYGCTSVILDQAYCSNELETSGFDLGQKARELGISVVFCPSLMPVLDADAYFPEVLSELQRATPPREKQGFTVFFTGLSGAGKSTLARALAVRLMEMGGRPVSLLDGDIVRRHLSSELGFSRQHRDINVRRIGFVASEITKNRGIAICAPIAPYRQTRRDVRTMIEAVGGFIEVHVSTPIQTCESRDRKGLYAKARAGLIPEFTGVSDPYETPEHPEVVLDTTALSVDEAVQSILAKLGLEGFL